MAFAERHLLWLVVIGRGAVNRRCFHLPNTPPAFQKSSTDSYHNRPDLAFPHALAAAVVPAFLVVLRFAVAAHRLVVAGLS